MQRIKRQACNKFFRPNFSKKGQQKGVRRYNCGKYGHFARDCRGPKKKTQGGQAGRQGEQPTGKDQDVGFPVRGNPAGLPPTSILELKSDYQSTTTTHWDDTPLKTLLDSGNSFHTVISEAAYLKTGRKLDELRPLKGPNTVITAEAGRRLTVKGQYRKPVRFELGRSGVFISTRPVVIPGMATELNISRPTLLENKADLITSKNAILCKGRLIPLSPQTKKDEQGIPASLVTFQVRRKRP